MERIGKYHVESRLGQGGMGTVYLALDPQIQRRVAIKMFKLELTGADPRTADRFRAEAQTTAGLRHPHIVTVYEYGEQDGVPYIVMEYLQGTDLHRVLQQGSKLSLLEKVRIVAEIASGLQYAHEKGIIHRDIKPANIMLLPNGSAMLTDFGIARGAQLADTRLTPTQLMMGTLAYMAPELFYHSEASIYSDMFAFGLVCYELLTGTHPFRAPTEAMVIQKILNEHPNPVRGLLTDCPENLSRAVERLLAKHKEHRFASLADFEMVLRPVLVQLRREHAAGLVPAAEQHLAADHLEEARRTLRKIADFDPGNASLAGLLRRLDERQQTLSVGPQVAALSAEAEKLIAGRRIDDALERLQQAIELNPGDHKLRARAAEIQEMRERSAQAQHLLEEALRDLEGRNLTAAQRKVNQARQADPEIPGAGAVLEKIQIERNRLEREAAVREALERSKMAVLMDNFAEACAVLEAALGSSPDSAELQRAYADARKARADHDRRRRIEEAKEQVRVCLEKNRETDALSVLDLLRDDGIEDADMKRLRAAVLTRLNESRQRAEVDAGLRQAREAIEHGNYAEARRILTGLNQVSHDDRIEALVEEADRRAAHQQRQSAISGVIARAEDFREKDRLGEAVALLERAIAELGADPRLTSLRDHLAALDKSRRQQRLNKAASAIESLLDQDKLTGAQQLLEESLPTAPLDRRLLELRTRLERQRKSREERQAAEAAPPPPPAAQPPPPAAQPPPPDPPAPPPDTGELSTARTRFAPEPAAPKAAPKPPPPPPVAADQPTRVQPKPAPPPPRPAAKPALPAAVTPPPPEPPRASRPAWMIPAAAGATVAVMAMGVLLLTRETPPPAPAPVVEQKKVEPEPIVTPPAPEPDKPDPPKQDTAPPVPTPTLRVQPVALSFVWTQGDPLPGAKRIQALGTGGSWKAVPSDPWLLVSPVRGGWNVGIVGSRVPPGRELRGEVVVSGSGLRSVVPVTAMITPKAPAPVPVPPPKQVPPEPKEPGRRILSASEYAGDPFGAITWMGELKDQETVTLTAGGASAGQLLGKRIGGEWFPPIRFSVQLAPALKVEQAPSEANRFNRLVIRNTSGAPVTTFRITWKQTR